MLTLAILNLFASSGVPTSLYFYLYPTFLGSITLTFFRYLALRRADGAARVASSRVI
jgi:hypothetical protein